MQFGEPNENGADLFFNLNQKENLFELKSLDYMSKKGLPKNIIPASGSDKLSVDNFSLKRHHKKIFLIKNVGSFPSEIKSVTLSNNQLQHREFSLKKLNSSNGELYEITFKPDFRHSRVQESILVKTKYSITEFKVEGFIPMNLIQFIDGNFRLTEIEESIGNWYYLIVLSFVLLTVFCLGTEIVEYIIYLKQKNMNVTILNEVLNAYEQAQEQAKKEKRLHELKEFLNSTAESLKKRGFYSENDPKAQLEEIEQKIKEKLVDRLDFTLPIHEPVKKPNKPTTSNLEPAKS